MIRIKFSLIFLDTPILPSKIKIMSRINSLLFVILLFSYSSLLSQNCSVDPTSVLPCDDGNPCTINDSEVILDSNGMVCVPCVGEQLDCSNGSTTSLPCDDMDPNTINDIETILDCDGSICIPCQGGPMFLNPFDWIINAANTNGLISNNGNTIYIQSDTDGTGTGLDEIDCVATDGTVRYCRTIQSSGAISFDWKTDLEPDFDPINERFGYCLNGEVTELTSVDPLPHGTSSGISTIDIMEGDELCFISCSKFSDVMSPVFYTLNNFIFDELSSVSIFSEIEYSNIYPNPTDGKVNVELDFDQPLNVSVGLLNGMGQAIKTLEMSNVNSVRQVFDVKNLPHGLYWLRIRSGEKSLVEKIIVE